MPWRRFFATRLGYRSRRKRRKVLTKTYCCSKAATFSWRYGAWSSLSTQLQSGLLDALLGSAGVPFPVITELDRTEHMRFIPLSADEIAKLRKAMPEFSPSVVPAGSYPSLTADYKTIGLFNFGVASKDLPDDLVYAIVKAFYANHDRLVEANPRGAGERDRKFGSQHLHPLPSRCGALLS
jgi:TRAP transporter TAXI family solute receptor